MTAILDRLAAHGTPYHDPVAAIDWTVADEALPWLPPRLLEVDGLGFLGRLSPAHLRRLSRAEFARLCAAGMWLEGLLINRVTERGILGARPADARVMLQEIREEAGHSLMFLEMIDRAGLAGVPLLGGTRLLTAVAHRLDPWGPEFWAMVYIGETVTDTFAMRALRVARVGGQAICPVARQVLNLHHRDEARHIAAAKVFLAESMVKMTPPRRLVFRAMLRFLLERFLAATLYPTTASLAWAGLPDPAKTAAAIRDCPARARLARTCAGPALALLVRDGLLGGAGAPAERTLP